MSATLCCIGTSVVVQTGWFLPSFPSTCFECVRHFPPLGIHGSAQTKLSDRHMEQEIGLYIQRRKYNINIMLIHQDIWGQTEAWKKIFLTSPKK